MRPPASVAQKIAVAAEEGRALPVKRFGEVDELLAAFDAALNAAAADPNSREARQARSELSLRCAAVAGMDAGPGLGCSRFMVMAFINAATVWRKVESEAPAEREAGRQAAEILAAAIRKARARAFGVEGDLEAGPGAAS